MKYNIWAAAILGVCLIAATMIYPGHYYFIRLDACSIARGDRWTGKLDTVQVHGKNCKWWDGLG